MNNENEAVLDYVCNLSPKYRKIAEIELNETEIVRSEALRKFRAEIKAHPRIKYCQTDPVFLLRFLRTKKFSVPRALQTLEKFLTVQQNYSHWYRNLDPADPINQELLSTGFLCPLSGRDAFGRRVLIARPCKLDTNRYTTTEVMRFTILVLNSFMMEEETQIAGIAVINDTGGLNLNILRLFPVPSLKTVFTTIQDATPIRINELNTINLPTFLRILNNFLLTFLNQKMKKRFIFEKTYNIDPKIAPKEYGGEIPISEMIEEYRDRLKIYRKELLKSDKNIIINPKKCKKPPVQDINTYVSRLEID